MGASGKRTPVWYPNTLSGTSTPCQVPRPPFRYPNPPVRHTSFLLGIPTPGAATPNNCLVPPALFCTPALTVPQPYQVIAKRFADEAAFRDGRLAYGRMLFSQVQSTQQPQSQPSLPMHPCPNLTRTLPTYPHPALALTLTPSLGPT